MRCRQDGTVPPGLSTIGDVGTTWLPGVDDDTVAALIAQRPDLAGLIVELRDHGAESIGQRLYDMLAIRAAQLIGDADAISSADPMLVRQVTDWPTDPVVSELERACLDVCESFIMDAHSVSDEQIVRIQRIVGDDTTIAVLMNLAVLDGFTKFRKVFSLGGQ